MLKKTALLMLLLTANTIFCLVYIGNLNTNEFDIDSVKNQFGTYENPYSHLSINNEFGCYDSQFSIYCYSLDC